MLVELLPFFVEIPVSPGFQLGLRPETAPFEMVPPETETDASANISNLQQPLNTYLALGAKFRRVPDICYCPL